MIYKIDISKPLLYFKAGLFQNPAGWQHKSAYLKGDFEIIIGIQGKFDLTLNAQTISIHAGDICVIPPYAEYEGTSPCTDDVRFYWLHFFPQSIVETFCEKEYLSNPAQYETSSFLFLPSFFHPDSLDKFHILMRQLLDLSHTGYYSTLASDYQATLVAMELTDQYLQRYTQKTEGLSESSQRFALILEWIRIHIYQNISVKALAKQFAIHPDYMNRLFQKNFSMSTSQYITVQKMSAVKSLIGARDLSIKEIADVMNFHDEKYLMRLFKKTEGITITEYRNAYTNTYMNNSQVDPDIPFPGTLPTSTSLL